MMMFLTHIDYYFRNKPPSMVSKALPWPRGLGHTIIPGGDVDQTFDNDVISGGESPVASHGSSNNNDNQQNEGEDSGNQNEGRRRRRELMFGGTFKPFF